MTLCIVHAAKSMVVYWLKEIKTKSGLAGDIGTRAYREFLRTLITNAPDDVK